MLYIAQTRDLLICGKLCTVKKSSYAENVLRKRDSLHVAPVVDKMPVDRARGSVANQCKRPVSSAIYCSYSIYGHAPSLQWTVETLCLTWYYER